MAEVRQAFSFSWRYVSFGVPDKLRDIAPELWDEERSKAAQLLTNAAEEAQQVMRTALAELVQHLAERLQTTDEGKPVQLHKSAVSNLLDFLDTLDFRNVTNDAELKRLADEARALLTGVNMKDLKSTGEQTDKRSRSTVPTREKYSSPRRPCTYHQESHSLRQQGRDSGPFPVSLKGTPGWAGSPHAAKSAAPPQEGAPLA